MLKDQTQKKTRTLRFPDKRGSFETLFGARKGSFSTTDWDPHSRGSAKPFAFRVPAVFCEFLRFSAVSCENLRFSVKICISKLNALFQGKTNPAFSKPCLFLSDTRHFRHFRRLRGSEEQNHCFQWVECKFVIFAVFVKMGPFWQGAKTRFTKNTVCATPIVF